MRSDFSYGVAPRDENGGVVTPDGALLSSITTWSAFEELAATWMRRLGFSDAVTTGRGADAGIDVIAGKALAQVKARMTATPRPDVQQLHGVASAEGKLGIFFSLSGYTRGAIDWAEEAGVALFVLESSGIARPIGSFAIRLAEELDDDGGASLTSDLFDVPKTFGSLLSKAELDLGAFENLIIHLPTGGSPIEQGRALVSLVASTLKRPMRVIEASDLGDGSVPFKFLQRLVPDEIIYLERVEQFPPDTLPLLLASYGGVLKLRDTSDAIDALLAGSETLPRVRAIAQQAFSSSEARQHVLLSAAAGQPALALAEVFANDLGVSLSAVSSRALIRGGDLAAILFGLAPGDVLYIEDLDRLDGEIGDMLRIAMIDRHITLVVGLGEDARTVHLEVPRFTVVAATTLQELSIWNDVFNHRFAFYASRDAAAAIVRRSWEQSDLVFEEGAPEIVAEHSTGIPRRALFLAHKIAKIHPQGIATITTDFVVESIQKFSFDDVDYTEDDWRWLGTANGTATAMYEATGLSPRFTVIMSTSLPWRPGNSVREAFGSLAARFPATLVLPELHSANKTMLRWELEDIPLLR